MNGSGEVNLKPAGTVHYSEALAEKYDAKTPHFFFTSPCDEWYRLEEDTNELAPEYVSLNPVWYLHVVVKDYGGQLKSTAVVTNKDGSKQRQIGVWYQAARSGGQNEPDMSRMHIRATITNLYTTGSFSFSKVSSANPDLGLPGAVFKLYRIPIATQGERSGETYQKAAARLKGGQVFDNSGEVADSLKEFKELYPDEYYAIVEKTAPAGYQVSANAVVIRTWYSRNSGRVECSVVSSGGFTLGRDGGALKWYDHPITVRIDKIVEGGYLLRGAYMQLLDSNGSVIERWMSGKINPHMVKAQLQLGQTYYIREVQAPAGYNRGGEPGAGAENAGSGQRHEDGRQRDRRQPGYGRHGCQRRQCQDRRHEPDRPLCAHRGGGSGGCDRRDRGRTEEKALSQLQLEF